MAWNNGFPVTYQQMYPQYQQQPQMPVFAPQMPNTAFGGGTFQNGNAQPVQQPQQQPAPMMTPPTIRAEIIQIDDDGWEDYVEHFPVAGGASQMFMTRSEGKIIIKSTGQTGPLPLIIYDKRPPEPPAPKFDPAEYMRKDDAQKMIAEQVETLVSAALTAQKAPQRKVKQEVE